MIKDGIKTLVVLIIFVLCICVGVAVYNVYVGTNENKEKGNKVEEEKLKDVLEFIHKNPVFYKTGVKKNILDKEQIIEIALETLSDEDFVTLNIMPVKILCEVTNRVSFTSENVCSIKAVNLDTFKQFILKYFDSEIEFELNDFENEKYVCKTDSRYLYCMKKNYKETVLSYFDFKEAYQNKDNIVIYEYYLPVSTVDEKVCNKYLENNYCLLPNLDEPPFLVGDKIRENGTLYKYKVREKDDYFVLDEIEIAN